MRYVPLLIVLGLLAGCGIDRGQDQSLTPAQLEEREKSVFWQFVQPRIQLDPIEEKEVPAIVSPGPEEREQ
jgi:hypothetical protein